MTTYTNVFGGNTIKPADVSYSALSLTSNQTLSWPGLGAAPFVSSIIDVTPDTAGRTLNMPDATSVSPGESVTFKNVGSDSFAVQDNSGGSIVTIASGAAYTVYLRTNSTAAGTWSYWQAGAGSSTTDAGAIDGAGLEAASGLLRVKMAVNSYSASQAFSDSDRGSMGVWTGGSGTFTMPSAASVGEGWYMHFKNDGSGTLTLAAAGSETFDTNSSVTLSGGEGCVVACDGTNFFTIEAQSPSASTFSYTSISIAGTGTYTLSAAEYANKAIKLTGLLTGNRNVVVPATARDYWINNATTGAYTVTVKTAAGTGVAVTQAKQATVYCDGTNVVSADTDYPAGLSTPIAVADGGTGAITAGAALTNLGGTTVGTQVFTAANAAAGRSALSAAGTGDANTFTNTQVISVSSAADALRITQTGAGNALVVEDSANPDSTPVVIDTSGALVVGHTSAYASDKSSLVGGNYSIGTFTANSSAFRARFIKSRSTDPAVKSAVLLGDTLGNITFLGDDGTNFSTAANISAYAAGTPSSGIVPGGMIISTADAAGTLTERFRINSTGSLGINGATYGTAGDVLISGGSSAAPSWSSAVSPLGQHTASIPAGAMISRTTNGAATGNVETTTNKVMIRTLDFDASTIEYAQFSALMPKGWDEGSLVAEFIWSHAAATTYAVVWGIQAIAFANDDALDTAFPTGVTTTSSGGTTNDLYKSSEVTFTAGGSPGNEEWVTFQVYREATSGSDTLNVDARLHGVKLKYTVNAATDS